WRGVALEDGGRGAVEVFAAASHVDVPAAAAQRWWAADAAEYRGEGHAAGAVGQCAGLRHFAHDQYLAGVVDAQVNLVAGAQVDLADAAGCAGEAVVVQLPGDAVADDLQVGQVRTFGVDACLADGFEQGQALGVDREYAGVLEGAAEVDFLAVVLDHVHVHLGLFYVAGQAAGDDFPQFFQSLAGHMHVADEGV